MEEQYAIQLTLSNGKTEEIGRWATKLEVNKNMRGIESVMNDGYGAIDCEKGIYNILHVVKAEVVIVVSDS